MAKTLLSLELVRNFTDVVGDGALDVGAAVGGFDSFTERVNVGDQFYYCIQGIDRPHEREVGRGTMAAGRRIERQPLGQATPFSNGLKTVALIAPADFYAPR